MLKPRITAIIRIWDLGIAQEEMQHCRCVFGPQIQQICVIVAIHRIDVVEA